MYGENFTDPPRDEDHFWEMIEDNYRHAYHILQDYHFETEEEAESGTYRTDADGTASLRPMEIIAHRDNSHEYDQREYCFELGNEKLAEVYDLMQERKLTPEFCQAWGVLQFCHGYIASHVFQDHDDFISLRNGKRSPYFAQKVWIAKIIYREIKAGKSHKEARREVKRLAQEFMRSRKPNKSFKKEWFSPIFKKDGELKSTYHESKLYGDNLKNLAEINMLQLPPLTSL